MSTRPTNPLRALNAATVFRLVREHLTDSAPENDGQSSWTEFVRVAFERARMAWCKKTGMLPEAASAARSARYCLVRPKHEYLVDYCWRVQLGTSATCLALALESEWGPSPWAQRRTEILYDFGKLLDIRAPVKVMVFANTTRRDYGTLTGTPDLRAYKREVLGQLEHAVKGHRLASEALERAEESYLIIDLAEHDHWYAFQNDQRKTSFSLIEATSWPD